MRHRPTEARHRASWHSLCSARKGPTVCNDLTDDTRRSNWLLSRRSASCRLKQAERVCPLFSGVEGERTDPNPPPLHDARVGRSGLPNGSSASLTVQVVRGRLKQLPSAVQKHCLDRRSSCRSPTSACRRGGVPSSVSEGGLCVHEMPTSDPASAPVIPRTRGEPFCTEPWLVRFLDLLTP